MSAESLLSHWAMLGKASAYHQGARNLLAPLWSLIHNMIILMTLHLVSAMWSMEASQRLSR